VDRNRNATYSQHLSLPNTGVASSGEVLRIVTQVVAHDFESAYTACYYLAEPIYDIAESIYITKDPDAAREAWFRAASYYCGADFFLHGNVNDPRTYSLWDQALASFKAMALLEPVPGERFTVKSYNSSIGYYNVPSIFFKAGLVITIPRQSWPAVATMNRRKNCTTLPAPRF
jgi:hypothetical protein